MSTTALHPFRIPLLKPEALNFKIVSMYKENFPGTGAEEGKREEGTVQMYYLLPNHTAE